MTTDWPIVVADIGGTNARFARAELHADGSITLDEPVVFPTDDFDRFEDAWPAVIDRLGYTPRAASLAVAGRVSGGKAQLTNARWKFDADELRSALNLDGLVVLNDLAAVAHAVATATDSEVVLIRTAGSPLSAAKSIGVVGVGTGFGFARVERVGRDYKVVATEAGHATFAPTDPFELKLVADLEAELGRVSIETLLSGGGLLRFMRALGSPVEPDADPAPHWEAALDGSDLLAGEALARLLGTLGATVGDLALSQGLDAIVLVGGIVDRVAHLLPSSAFTPRFADKAPMSAQLETIGIFQPGFDHPGLIGAARALEKSLRAGD